MSLAILSDVLKAPLVGKDLVFTGVSTDTRTLKAGDLFVALKGANYDGHSFLAEAIGAGAVGALLSSSVDTPLPHVRVKDTRRALGDLAAFWRRQFNIPVIAVTGSNGKTTVKEMIAAIMGEKGPGCVTRGNLNNDIGVPLTLLGLKSRDRYAVIEMAMNHRGEIEYLSRMTRPTIALITNAGEAHIESLGSVEFVAHAKGEVFAGLSEEGIAVINADDPYCELWKKLAAPRTCLTFGLDSEATVRARCQQDGLSNAVHLETSQGDIDMRLHLLGKHNALNAAGAAATSLAAGATLQDVQSGLAKLKSISGRLEIKEGVSGARVVDDTYNANPSSLAVGLQVLRDFAGERVLVLGDMAELGESAKDIHRRVGELASQIGINRLYALGELSKFAAKSFGKGAKHFTNQDKLIEALHNCMHSEMTVLVKGSRIMQMEQVIVGIVRKHPAGIGRRTT